MNLVDFPAEEAFRFVDSLWAKYFVAPEPLTVEQWADSRLVLPREMSSEPGPMRLSRTPYLRQIFQDLADPGIAEIDLMFGTQLGKSTALIAAMGYVIDHDPAPIMMVRPTRDEAKQFSKQRIAPLVAANDCLSRRIAPARERNSSNTVLVKVFAGGILVMTGANSPAGLASMPAKWLLFDEVDDYPEDAGGQGEPTAIATARQDTYARRKCIKCSSPKRPKGLSMIEAEFEAGCGFRYFVPCPHCGHKQTLRWAQLKWRGRDPSSAAYACEECGALISEHFKTQMLEGGEWHAARPEIRKRSYHLNSLYSPLGWLSWAKLAGEWIRAQDQEATGRLGPLRAFINTRLAETWEEKAAKLAPNELREAAEPFPLRQVPQEGLLLVAFVDVQDNRFEVGVWALGRDDHMYTVDHRVIPANPGLLSDWGKVDAALAERYWHVAGVSMGIEAAAIDSGGHYTHDVYRFVRSMPTWRRIAATKGAGTARGMPIFGKSAVVDVNIDGATIKGGVRLWFVGVNEAKDLLFNRIAAGRVHISRDLPANWFEQMTAEHRTTKRSIYGERNVWVKKAGNARNEAWDIAVGAIWCAERLGVSSWPETYWQQLHDGLQPDPQKPQPSRPRPRNFATNW